MISEDMNRYIVRQTFTRVSTFEVTATSAMDAVRSAAMTPDPPDPTETEISYHVEPWPI